MICESNDLVHVGTCSTCNEEYIGETGEEKTRVRGRVRVYRQHMRQPQYQQIKREEYFRTCGKGEFKIFPFFKLHSHNKYLKEQNLNQRYTSNLK